MKKYLAMACIILLVFSSTAVWANETNPEAVGQPIEQWPAMVPKPLPKNDVIPNPYMGQGDSIIHNDPYSSDVTDAVTSLGINPEWQFAVDQESPNAPPAAFFDNAGRAVVPYLGGVAIRNLASDVIETYGSFVPTRDDQQQYTVQISYSFVDAQGHIVLPTNHGHVIMLKTTDEKGQLLSTFEKVLDVDVVEVAQKKLGQLSLSPQQEEEAAAWREERAQDVEDAETDLGAEQRKSEEQGNKDSFPEELLMQGEKGEKESSQGLTIDQAMEEEPGVMEAQEEGLGKEDNSKEGSPLELTPEEEGLHQEPKSGIEKENSVSLEETESTPEAGNIENAPQQDLEESLNTQEESGEGDLSTKLLSIIFDYQGNLWFVTGGFHINPAHNPDGFMGYLSREYIDRALSSGEGEAMDLDDNLFFYRLTGGEGAENGISSCAEGVVILSNKACYLATADQGVQIKWRTPYESVGVKRPADESRITGGGLAWGGGSTPTLTNDLVLFTDNLDPVNLLALSVKTGDIVAQTPILDQLPTNTQVTVENSILVYSADPSRTSVVVCNWFGAGNAELTEPGSDSSIQTYENIYDPHWIQQGNVMLDPGVERVDFIRQGDRYTAQTLWTREDIRDTSMIKLATGTGYLYGYWQNLDTSMWSYYALDFDTGETVLEVPVSSEPAYNNMAVGMIVDVTGNALYCPTNKQQLLRLQDRFVYLPDARMQRIDLDKTKRYVLEETALCQGSGMAVTPASYLCSAVISPQDPETLVAFRINGLSQIPSALTLFLQTPGQQYVPMEAAQWQLTDAWGEAVPADQELNPNTVYDIRFFLEDQGDTDLDPREGTVEVAMVLGQSPRVEAPVFTPSGGGFSGNVKVQLACATPGAAIHYTLDGTKPNSASEPYTTPIQLSKTTEVKAIAMKEGMQESPVVSAVFTRQSASSSGGGGGGSSGGKGENKVISGESIVSKADLTTFNPEVMTQEGLARVTITSTMGEQLLAEAEQAQSSQLVIQPHITGEPGRVLVALPQSFIQELVDQTAMGLIVDTVLGKVFIPYQGLREISQQTGDTVTIDLEKTSQGNTTINMQVDGNGIPSLSRGIMVTLPRGQDSRGLVAERIIGEGQEEIIPLSVLEGQNMLVLLPNSCTLHIRDNSKAFEDTANHWAKEAIAFVTARELFAGVSASLFKPDMPMERGMMVTVLYHLAGNPQGLADATFADVKSSDYFAQPVAWAEQHHIAQGTGEHLFEPYGHLTREELAVFTYQYVQYLGWETPVEGNAIREFNDADQISPWAREAMSFAIHADILRGKEGQKLAPQDLATRGEVAVVLEQLVRFLIENVG